MSHSYHFQLMADYNRRMNEQVYLAASCLSEFDLTRDLGAYFGSVLGSLNHVMVADLLWLRRFNAHSAAYTSLSVLAQYPETTELKLNTILYPAFANLYQARCDVDALIQHWLKDEVSAEDLARDLTYANVKGQVSTRNFGELLAHFFNHQTHHRGQVSTLLSQLGYDIGVTDFLIDIPEQHGRED